MLRAALAGVAFMALAGLTQLSVAAAAERAVALYRRKGNVVAAAAETRAAG